MPKLATPLFCALLAALALAASAGTATASPLKLDRSFGKAGLVQPDFGPAYLPISYDAVQAEPSGAVVVARALGGSGPVWRRYDATGVLDPSFDPNSGAYPPIEAVTAEGKTLRPDGGLILRYNADGTWDKTFGVDPEPGHRPFSEAVPFLIRALVSLPSGKIAAAGWDIKHDRRRREIRQILVARFDSQGHLDPGFGGDGVVNLASDAGFAVKRLAGLAAHGDEGVVVAADERLRRSYGITNPFHGNSLVLALGADGRPDPAFGKEGAVRSRSSIEEFQVLPGGNLLVAGDRWGAELHVNSARLSDLYAMRLTPAGQPDPGFDGDGLAVADFGGVDRFGSLQVEADGGLLLGGSSTGIGDRICVRFPGYCTETPVLARLLADGTPDPGFGDGGRVRLKALSEPFASLGAGGGVEALAPLPGGEVAAGGSSGAVAFLAKIDRAGALVGGFGSGGVVTERDPHHNETTAHAVAVDARGRILVAGSTSAGTFYASPENGVV
ncbi:MAG TPA: hypothetical protein VFB52_03245, partial [Solirubrobacterales bacterium]|nr:hypothetical protein [Solirubrobacterales bacterium]